MSVRILWGMGFFEVWWRSWKNIFLGLVTRAGCWVSLTQVSLHPLPSNIMTKAILGHLRLRLIEQSALTPIADRQQATIWTDQPKWNSSQTCWQCSVSCASAECTCFASFVAEVLSETSKIPSGRKKFFPRWPRSCKPLRRSLLPSCGEVSKKWSFHQWQAWRGFPPF